MPRARRRLYGARFPGARAAWQQGDESFAIEGGESRAAVYARVHAAVREMLAAVPQRTVVVVAHGGVMRQLLSTCFGPHDDLRHLSFANTATHIIRVDQPAWSYAGQL